MILEELTALLDSGEFHHATYRNQGTLWEGLWVYRNSDKGFQGYEVAGCFPKGEEGEASRELSTRRIGTHVGAFGTG